MWLWHMWSTVEKIQAFLDLAVVVFTAGMWWTFFQQRKAIQESNGINREALETVQRAYVNFSPNLRILHWPNKEPTYYTFVVPVANNGSTPTRNLIEKGNVYFAKEKLPKDFDFHDFVDEPSHSFLAPKETQTSNVGKSDTSAVTDAWHQ